MTPRQSICSTDLPNENEDVMISVDYNKIETIKENEIYPTENPERNAVDLEVPSECATEDIFSTGSLRRAEKKINKAKIEKIISAEKLSEMIKVI